MSVTSSKRARGEQKDENIQLGQLSYLEWTAKFKDDYPFEFTTTKKLLDEQLPETLKRLQAANNNAVKALAAAEKPRYSTQPQDNSQIHAHQHEDQSSCR